MIFNHPTELKHPHDLIGGAIANAKNTEFRALSLWVVIMKIFGCGSTKAVNLCSEYGFDPDKELPPIECPVCKEDMIYICGTEDELIILNKHGSWHETIYASCPQQAKEFYSSYKDKRYNTIEDWENTLYDFQVGWEIVVNDLEN